MIDLDSLADKRARVLGQQNGPWRELLWSRSFQILSQSMTDGEITGLLDDCHTAAQLKAVILFLDSHGIGKGESPYGLLVQGAQSAGLTMSEWIKNLAKK